MLLHVLIATLDKFLKIDLEKDMCLAEGDIPKEIPAKIFSMAEELITYFSTQRRIFNQVKISFKLQYFFQKNANIV